MSDDKYYYDPTQPSQQSISETEEEIIPFTEFLGQTNASLAKKENGTKAST